jgi:carbonic anhydrase
MAEKTRGTLLGLACASALLVTAASGTVHWNYEGAGGPKHWGSLDPAFAACAVGTEQSPIDLADAKVSDLPSLAFDYAPSPITILNNGHTIQVGSTPGSGIVLDGLRYELVQFHFHHASEHTVDGIRFPLELHLVHRNDSGALAVVGVLFKVGDANEALKPLWSHLPAEASPTTVVPGEVDVAALLPGRRTTWRYPGSLTTPPCSEGVSWLVMTEPVTLSVEQIKAFGAIFPHNFRPVQPLNGRVVWRDVETR